MMTPREQEWCSGIAQPGSAPVGARRHLELAKKFAQQDCGDQFVDVNKKVDHIPDSGKMVNSPGIPGSSASTRKIGAQKVSKQLPSFGPGTELAKILASLGIVMTATCPCKATERKMNEWGVAGCILHRDELASTLRSNATKYGWKTKWKAAALTVTSGIVFKLNVLDPFPGLVDLAIRRAEEQQSSGNQGPPLEITASVTSVNEPVYSADTPDSQRQFAVGVTTAPRAAYYLPRTLESLGNAGFGDPIIFAEPGSRQDEIPPTVRWIQHAKNQGAFGNWRFALRHLLESQPTAQMLLIVQDDVVFARNVRKLLEGILWPHGEPEPEFPGAISLYCAANFATGTGLHQVDRPKFFGACAMLFPRPVAEMIACSRQFEHKDAARKIDMFICGLLSDLGASLWAFSPSLCQHIGETASDFLKPMGHGGAHGNLSSSCFVGETYNCSTDGYPWSKEKLVATNKLS